MFFFFFWGGGFFCNVSVGFLFFGLFSTIFFVLGRGFLFLFVL